MSKHFVEAYDVNDKQILGTLDGQTVIRARCYKRTKAYKALVAGRYEDGRQVSNRAAYWKVVSLGGNAEMFVRNQMIGG